MGRRGSRARTASKLQELARVQQFINLNDAGAPTVYKRTMWCTSTLSFSMHPRYMRSLMLQ
jgi:hypothetical protein